MFFFKKMTSEKAIIKIMDLVPKLNTSDLRNLIDFLRAYLDNK